MHLRVPALVLIAAAAVSSVTVAARPAPVPARAPAPAAAPPAQITTYFLGQNYGNKPRTDPLYAENRFDLFYPEGSCPISGTCDGPSGLPVVIFLRGGNANNPLTNPAQISPLCEMLRQSGFVVAVPSYHVVDVTIEDDWLQAARDLGRMVQYLRRFKTILNIDADRIFTLGHSGGGFYCYFLGLNVDFRNPASPDLVEQESSRPNAIVPWGSTTDWDCMDLDNPATNPTLLEMFLNDTSSDATLFSSPVYWLQNPELYGRVSTPPMCLVYNFVNQNPCGTITDFHDGYFGPHMMSFVTRFCGGSGMGQPVCTESTLIDSNGDLNTIMQSVADWMIDLAGQ